MAEKETDILGKWVTVQIKGWSNKISSSSNLSGYYQKSFAFRLAFLEDYTLKSLRLKQDKWNKLIISDEQRNYLMSFIDKGKFLANF